MGLHEQGGDEHNDSYQTTNTNNLETWGTKIYHVYAQSYAKILTQVV